MGPIQDPVGIEFHDLSNLQYRGTYRDIEDIDFSQYDFFLFTSLFEGMPITVLEVAQFLIPIIAADVGGLRETFSAQSLFFVDMAGTSDEIVHRFLQQIDRLLALSSREITKMVAAAKTDVEGRHSEASFQANIKNLLLMGGRNGL
jgi:glycosyltransferase involved in cell wall biosynthesis